MATTKKKKKKKKDFDVNSLSKGQRSKVRDQRSEIKGQRSKIREILDSPRPCPECLSVAFSCQIYRWTWTMDDG